MDASTRVTFGTKLGILAATAGSAVGLGNIWRFPSETATGGGAIFVFIYLACVLFFGIPVVLAEFIVGRAGKANPAGAYRNLAPGTPFHYFGIFAVVAVMLILGFYMVVAGWTFDYFWLALTGTLSTTTDFGAIFGGLANNTWRQTFWLGVSVVSTAVIVGFGVKKGIEFASKLMMPMLFLILVVMCFRAITLPNAVDGLVFLFRPNLANVTPDVFVRALGQTFFSLSLGMGCLITYASYFGSDVKLGKTAGQLAVVDTSVAVLAGVTIFSTAFAAAGTNAESVTAALVKGGPGLIFETLPQLFQSLPLGQLWAALFFFLLILATITSAISMYEIATAFLNEEFKIKRVPAVILISAFSMLVGYFAAASIGSGSSLVFFGKTLFDWLDTITATWMMPVGGLFVSWFTGWYLDRKLVYAQLSNDGSLKIRFFKTYIYLLRYVAPVGIISIFLVSVFPTTPEEPADTSAEALVAPAEN